jgi:hypothetical protein
MRQEDDNEQWVSWNLAGESWCISGNYPCTSWIDHRKLQRILVTLLKFKLLPSQNKFRASNPRMKTKEHDHCYNQQLFCLTWQKQTLQTSWTSLHHMFGTIHCQSFSYIPQTMENVQHNCSVTHPLKLLSDTIPAIHQTQLTEENGNAIMSKH